MSETKYPLCARAGLKIVEFTSLWAHSQGELVPNSESAFVSAAVVEKLLAGAPVVYGHKNKYDIFEWGQYSDEQMMVEGPGLNDTHTARLLLIEKIEPKTCPTCGGKIENHKD